ARVTLGQGRLRNFVRLRLDECAHVYLAPLGFDALGSKRLLKKLFRGTSGLEPLIIKNGLDAGLNESPLCS
ncbi:MAG TPA: hypothetical protein VFC29_06500, partial [Candidatus Limnocylindrales bacterium]|nr:hypothetical protein [Candidatus Limnocylindrales bacterium]